MARARPRLLLNIVKARAPIAQFPETESYCGNHASWRKELAEYHDVPKGAAKVAPAEICYGGRPCAEILFLTQLAFRSPIGILRMRMFRSLTLSSFFFRSKSPLID